jgi:hypothetical protein
LDGMGWCWTVYLVVERRESEIVAVVVVVDGCAGFLMYVRRSVGGWDVRRSALLLHTYI